VFFVRVRGFKKTPAERIAPFKQPAGWITSFIGTIYYWHNSNEPHEHGLSSPNEATVDGKPIKTTI